MLRKVLYFLSWQSRRRKPKKKIDQRGEAHVGFAKKEKCLASRSKTVVLFATGKKIGEQNEGRRRLSKKNSYNGKGLARNYFAAAIILWGNKRLRRGQKRVSIEGGEGGGGGGGGEFLP